MKFFLKTFIFCSAIFLFTGCVSQNEILNSIKETGKIETVYSFKTGTFYGECGGYCFTSMEITKEKIIFTKRGSYFNGEIVKKEVTREMEISAKDWNDMVSSFNLEQFKSLPIIFGCPDCTDGGGEWIEIGDGVTTKRITFDDSFDGSDLKTFFKQVRKIRNKIIEEDYRNHKND